MNNSLIYNLLEQQAKAYINFMQNLGQYQAQFSHELYNRFFTEDLVKQAMGKIVATGAKELELQLAEAKTFCDGIWEMKLVGDILVDSNKSIAVIYFIFKGKNTQIFSTMTQLHFEKIDLKNLSNSVPKIKQIVEVFGKFEEAW